MIPQGPRAPHGFRVLARKHLKADDWQNATETMAVATGQPHEDDIMLAVFQYMSDASPFQICWLFSAAEVCRLQATMRRQPTGMNPRRTISRKDRMEVKRQADLGLERAAISQAAHSFLTSWIQETLRRGVQLPEPFDPCGASTSTASEPAQAYSSTFDPCAADRCCRSPWPSRG